MTQVIIYKTDEGKVAVIHPTPEALSVYGIESIAKKDVPSGKCYKIIPHTDLPATRENRDSWEFDESLLTDGVGSESSEF